MNWIKMAIYTVGLVLLVGCSVVNEDKSAALLARTTLLEMTRYTAQCDVVADYGQRLYEFSVLASFGEGETTLTVTAPDNISGIKLKQKGVGGDTALIWEDIILETGDLTTTKLTPLTAIPWIITTAKTGYIAGVSERILDERTVLELYCRDPEGEVGTGIETLVWLDPTDHSLLGGEIFEEGRRVLTCTFTQFVIS